MAIPFVTKTKDNWLKRSLRNARAGFIGIAVLLILIIWTTTFYQAKAEYKSDLESVTIEHDNLGSVIEERTRGMLQLSDSVLVLTQQLYENSLNLNSAMDFKSVTYILKNAPFIAQLTLVNESGDIVYKGFAEQHEAGAVSDSDYFLAHKAQDSGDIYIGKPLFNSEEQKWLVPISRRVNKPDGSFAGVVVAQLDLSSVFDLIHETQHTKDHVFAIIGLDGIARSSWYNDDLSSGQMFGPLPTNLTHSKGSFISKNPIDNVQQIRNYRIMNDYPLIVVCGVDERSAMAGFYEQRNIFYGLALLISIFVAIASLLLFNSGRKRQSAEYLLRRNVLQYQHVAQHSKDIILVQNKEGQLIFISPAVRNILGYDEETLLNKPIYDLVSPDDHNVVRSAYDRLAGGENSVTFEFRASAENGTYIWLESHSSRLDDDVEHCLIGYQCLLRDISRQKKAEEQVLDISNHDSLTGIYNHHYFELAMKEFDQEVGYSSAVIVIDIVGLKLINESFGYAQGDRILLLVANALTEQTSPADVVARIAGDEFSILLKDVSPEGVEEVVASIRRQIDAVNQAQIQSGMTIGLSIGYSSRLAAEDKLASTSMKELFDRANLNMQKDQVRSGQMAMSAIVEMLKRTLEARDIITHNHSNRMFGLIEKMAIELGFDQTRIKNALFFAELHDIGKLGIPDRILQKPGPLTGEERIEMQRHSEIGYRIALAAPELAPIAEWILKHHEWWDGTGYPLGLRGTDIPLECRILGIVDAYDAMVNDRPYRGALSEEDAIAELRRFAGRQFDPGLTALFIDFLVVGTYAEPHAEKYSDSSGINKLALVHQFETIRKCIDDLHGDWQLKESAIDEFMREEWLDKQVDPARAEELTRLFVRKILAGIPNPAVIKDQHSNFVYCNSAFYQTFGFSEEDVIGRQMLSTIDQELTDRIIDQDSDLLNGLPGLVKELKIDIGSSEDSSLLFNKTVIRDGQNEAIAIIEVMTDTSMHQYINQTLQRYHLILNFSRDVILLIRPDDGQILESNVMASELYGYSLTELRAMSIYDLRESGTVKPIHEQMNKAIGKGNQFTSMHRSKDGTIIPVLIHSGGTEIDGKSVLVSIIRDIRDWVKVSDDLKRHNDYLTILHETTLSLINHLDLQDLLTKIVARAADLFKTPHAFLFLVDENGERMSMRVGTGICAAHIGMVRIPSEGVVGIAWQTGQPFCVQQYNMWNQHLEIPGEEGEYAVLGVPLKLMENVIGVFGILGSDSAQQFSPEDIQLVQGFIELASLAINNASLYDTIQHDVTQRKQMEEELLRNNSALTQALDVLKSTQSNLIQHEKFAGIGQLAAGVAHEINNPLGFVLSNFETLQKYTGRLSDMVKTYRELHKQVLEEQIPSLQDRAQQIFVLEKQKKLDYVLDDLEPIFGETAEGLSRVSNIVKALRLFSRVDQQGNYEEYDMNEGIRNSLTVARNEIKYVAEVTENLTKLPSIKAMSGQINQVLLNILINAAHSIKANGSQVLGMITVSTYADDRFVYCSIADSGIGIPENIRNNIFDPFFTTKPIGQGTGLGLSISYDIIVNKHQGEILLESEVGKGSTFIIKLPVDRLVV